MACPADALSQQGRVAFLRRYIEVEVDFTRAQLARLDAVRAPSPLGTTAPLEATHRRHLGPERTNQHNSQRRFYQEMLTLLEFARQHVLEQDLGALSADASAVAPVKHGNTHSAPATKTADSLCKGHAASRGSSLAPCHTQSCPDVDFDYLGKRVEGFQKKLNGQNLGRREAGRLACSLARMEGARARRNLVLQAKAAAKTVAVTAV